jgi:LysM repeat protein
VVDTLAQARQKFDDAALAIINLLGQLIPTKVVTVQKGDTLWSLATRELGSGAKWPEVYFMDLDVIKANQAIHTAGSAFDTGFSRDFSNKLAASPSAIYVGQKLLIMTVPA